MPRMRGRQTEGTEDIMPFDKFAAANAPFRFRGSGRRHASLWRLGETAAHVHEVLVCLLKCRGVHGIGGGWCQLFNERDAVFNEGHVGGTRILPVFESVLVQILYQIFPLLF